MNKCVSIFGPTASGKTGLAIKLADLFNGVIISCDSMQIYKNLEIGTAKPTSEERKKADFRLIDFIDLSESFSVYDYKLLCYNEIRKVISEGKLPIVCGGTGLYFDAVINNTEFGDFKTDKKIHDELIKRSGDASALLEELRSIDPQSAEKLHEKDLKKIIRALEVFYSTGKTLTEYKINSHSVPPEFDFLNLNLTFFNRENLYNRINMRVDEMISCGLVDETKAFLENGYFNSKTASQAIGYKEIIQFLSDEISFEEAVALIKQHTRNYAKRQITWFKRYKSNEIIMDSFSDPVISSSKIIEEFLKK